MTAIERTAYPRLKKNLTRVELAEIYTPTDREIAFTLATAHGQSGRLTLLVLLKCFQRLGYFPVPEKIPVQIRQHILDHLEYPTEVPLISDALTTLSRYRVAIRSYLNVKLYSDGGETVAWEVVQKAAQTMTDPADLINVTIEQLVAERFELPTFSTIARLVNHIRTLAHLKLYATIEARLGLEQRVRLDNLLSLVEGQTRTDFTRLD